MLEALARLDRELFLFLNSLHQPWLDPVMVIVSSRFFWIPFYVGLTVFIVYLLRKRALLLLPLIGVAVLLADRVSSGFFKPYFARLRPCHDTTLAGLVHFVDGCGGQFGFISSHSANTFALATILHLLLRPAYRWFRVLLWVWAVLVSYSRVYLGVHYPADILMGAILGTSIGLLIFWLYKLLEKRWFV